MTLDSAKLREWARLARVARGMEGDSDEVWGDAKQMRRAIDEFDDAVLMLIEALVEERAKLIHEIENPRSGGFVPFDLLSDDYQSLYRKRARTELGVE